MADNQPSGPESVPPETATPKPMGIEAFDEIKRLVVVAAHPDDLECICGGTIALLAERGVEIFSVICTLGDIGSHDPSYSRATLAAARLEESEAAARLLGIMSVYNLGRHDGELEANLQLRGEIARIYRLTQADALFTFDPFWTGQIHADHRAAGQAALDAYMPAKMPLYHPEHLLEEGAGLGQLAHVYLFSTDRQPNIYVDISAVQPRKLQSCMAYPSQFPKGEEDLQWLKEMDAETGAMIQAGAAEAFKSMRVW
jgi:LmbE family N-acetylglucosaminyl deacetylase